MAKIRLNEERRDMLLRLAVGVVDATPIDPAIEKRLATAKATYDTIRDAMLKEARRIHKAGYTPGDLRVLKKHRLLKQTERLIFVDLDTRNRFEVCMWDPSEYNKVHLPKGFTHPQNLAYEEREKYEAKRQKSLDKASVQVASLGTHNHALTSSDELYGLCNKFRTAKDELGMAEEADQDYRRRIMSDFNALIRSARTYEDVVEIWPEAKTLAGAMADSAQQVSVMSQEAIDRIRNNMASRGIK